MSAPDLPVYLINGCPSPFAPGQPESFYTTDPGKALITGSCGDFNRVKGPVLRGLAARAPYFHNGAAADLHVEACLFSRPPDAAAGMGTTNRSAALLRQASSGTASGIVYSGKNNRYHNLDAAWLTGDGAAAVDWRDFDRRLADTGGSDRYRE